MCDVDPARPTPVCRSADSLSLHRLTAASFANDPLSVVDTTSISTDFCINF
jgi:hypothetical protein